MAELTSESIFDTLFNKIPSAHAVVKGSRKYPDIIGNVMFYELSEGTIVLAEIFGLPKGKDSCSNPIFGFHIHEGRYCTGDEKDPFKNAMMHYDTKHCMHPFHQGDMPVLFGNDGFAFLAFYTDRFRVREVVGRTVIIHDRPDDFRTQPSGDSGEKIACGVIRYFQLWK